MSSFFELQRSLKEYLEDLSVTPAEASFYVRSMMAGLADTALRTPADRQDALPAEHETMGGLNERIRRTLQDRGWFNEPGSAFDRLTGIDRKSLE
jgi:pyrroline-5-carboxylate reductase